MPFKRRQWDYYWRHPSGDLSCGFVPGLHRTKRSATQAVVRTLTTDWPPCGGASRPVLSQARLTEGYLTVGRT